MQVPKQLYSLEDLRMNKIQPEALLAPTDDTLGKIRTGLQVCLTHGSLWRPPACIHLLGDADSCPVEPSDHRLALSAFFVLAPLQARSDACLTLGRISALRHRCRSSLHRQLCRRNPQKKQG